ncbi:MULTISPECIES: hypothetical protein [Bacillus]|uniref:Uncharacterized protein n=3 Tax=Bacillus cereus TaxID=1396 RepID=A0A9X6VS96_BACCE|nr:MULTISPECIES: hypothetical protein [Bacillus cereus group]WIK99146.1 hypothetical protein QPL86_29050 [Bacillus bombysepticus]EEL61191.1 hypothetical protein bcere0025_61340 [Bacillus cereus F65185]EJP85967.1 hypothetical protein IC1_04385 [Bacillus cereus VD022]EKS7870943.1 hypothetical protein [Bacillus cereus]EOQ59769.1 hypothetical protein IAY_03911 [Bacillus cereus TIAC219]
MKKFLGLVFVVVILAFGVFQPYSLNLEKVFAQDNTSNNINNNTKEKKIDCVPCKKPENLSKNETNKFADEQILDKVKKQLTDLKQNKLSIYSTADFEWKEAVKVDYKENKTSAIIIPSKENPKSNDTKQYLTVGFNESESKFADPTFLELKTPNNGDTILLTVKTLDGENVGTLDLNSKDGKLNQMKLFTDGKSESILKENNAKAGYWEDVQRCIKNNWKTMPQWAKWACEGACGGCLFASPYACGGCLGCLAGYAIGCAASQI